MLNSFFYLPKLVIFTERKCFMAAIESISVITFEMSLMSLIVPIKSFGTVR